MGEEATAGRYVPDPAFEEVKEEAMLDMSPTDSKEFWLIQWIKDKDLDVSGFHGKNLSLKLHKDGNFGSLESSSGKSYDLVSYAYQQPNANIFLPSGSETKAVGKISRRVCLVHHRKHEELEKLNFGNLVLSSKKSAAEKAAAELALMSLPQEARPLDQSAAQGSVLSVGAMNKELAPRRKKRRMMKVESNVGPSDASGNPEP